MLKLQAPSESGDWKKNKIIVLVICAKMYNKEKESRQFIP
jgi:hypothetical protein